TEAQNNPASSKHVSCSWRSIFVVNAIPVPICSSTRTAAHACGGPSQSIRRFNRLQVIAQMIGKLIQYYSAFLRLILPFRRLAMEHRFPISDQSRELIFEPHEMPRCFAEVQPFSRNQPFQSPPLLAQLPMR